MTTTYYSAQVTLTRAGTLNPSASQGALQVQYFYYLVPAATLAVADLLMLGVMPDGARFLGGKMIHSAGGVAVTANIGDYTIVTAPVVITAAKYGALTDMTLAGHQDFGELPTTGFGGLETDDVYLGLVTAAQIFPAAGTLMGYYRYLL